MRLIAAFLKLVRLPNLLFIALAQLLFQFCIYQPLYEGAVPKNDLLHFILLLFASLFIAAAGYIINDYFDINIDEVNKPERMVVDKHIHRRWAIAWHFMLSSSGLIFTLFALPFAQKWYLVLANAGSVLLLWFYSTNFKKGLLFGNFVISLLTAWTILVIFFSKLSLADATGSNGVAHAQFFRISFLYAGFAFIISLIREAVKDLEDIPGDQKYGCRTLPIVWGVNAAKLYAMIWIIILLGLLLVLQFYVLQFRWWGLIAYSLVLVMVPLVYILLQLSKPLNTVQYHSLSNWTKLVMLTGIVSMLFFYFYL